jgi:diguanylate cyclase
MEKADYAIYNQEKDDWEKHQFRLLTDCRQALDNTGELNCALQPIICLSSGKCISVESLIRWNHPELGNVPPNHFLPYVEQSALIMPFTEVTIASSLQLHTYFAKKGYDGNISINLSTMVFRINKLFSRISELINFYNVKSDNISFEITETAIMEHPKAAIYMLNQLRELGCKISIDDFGIGHSSLAYLADLPIDTIKIDQYFVSEIDKKSNMSIIYTTATHADKLGLKTVAEGIETENQYNICKELGVNYGQGYYFAKPLLKQDFSLWLKNKHSAKMRLV